MSTQESKQKKAVGRPKKPERRVRVRIADLVRNAASSKKLVADMPYAQKLTVGRIVRSIQRRLEEDEQATAGAKMEILGGNVLHIIPGFDGGIFMRLTPEGSMFDVRSDGEVLPPANTRVELFPGTEAARHVRTFSPGMLKMCAMFAAAVAGDDLALCGKDIYSGFRPGLIPEYARYFAYKGKDKATADRLQAELFRRRDELIAYTREKQKLEGESAGSTRGKAGG